MRVPIVPKPKPLKPGAIGFDAVELFVPSPLRKIRDFEIALTACLPLCFAAKLRQRITPGFSLGFAITDCPSRETATTAFAVSRLWIVGNGSPQAEAG